MLDPRKMKVISKSLYCLLFTAIKANEPADSEVMDRRLQQLAGPHALNCGHVKVKKSPTKATSCAQRAFKRGQPFYVRYDFKGIDSDLAGGLASDGQGNLFEV